MSVYFDDYGMITYLSGVDSDGRVAARAYATWNDDAPATYGSSVQMKWGQSAAGTGATISYGFEAASRWSGTEQAGFVAALHLWQAVANVTFIPAASADSAQVLFERDHDGHAEASLRGERGEIGSSQLGRATFGRVEIDTDVTGYGGIGGTLSDIGGFPHMTVLHEIGHVLGMGHAGPYDGERAQPTGGYDVLTHTIMSYTDSPAGWGRTEGYANVPATPMVVDILAAQRLYGMPVNSPLSGGQVYGFNSNIGGDIGRFFDFSINSRPVVTLWNAGADNALDLSGYASASEVRLRDGTTSSVGGLQDNLAIAIGTRIDTLFTGSGADRLIGNDNANVIMAGGGDDSVEGGWGNDHLFGAANRMVADDGADTIEAGPGDDYLQGNGGNDWLDGDDGFDRIQGGGDNDLIEGGTGNDTINGNLGDDRITGGPGNDLIRGGKGNDQLNGNWENDVVMGDFGDDIVNGGSGIDSLTGGPGADTFVFELRDATRDTMGYNTDPYVLEAITDFEDGIDHIHFGGDFGLPSEFVRMEAGNLVSAIAIGEARYGDGGTVRNDIMLVDIGGDTLVFFSNSSSPTQAFRLEGFSDPANLTVTDFI